MPKLIKDNAIIDDEWQIIPRDHEGCLPPGKLILPLNLWLDLDEKQRTDGSCAPWLDVEDDFEALQQQLITLPLIAVNFPTFTDGRGFSTAQILRTRLGFNGDLRAIGYLLADQLYYLKRCGFTSFQLPESIDLQEALKALETFSSNYQISFDTTKLISNIRNH